MGSEMCIRDRYQGGVSVVDFTDSANPVEIAFFDRGPLDEEELITAGYWSTYWYGGHIYGTEIARGLDVFSLEPSDFITANEIAAASLKDADLTINAQTQQRVTWPDVPVVARAYMDQLQRSNVISSSQILQLSNALDQAERLLSSNSSNSGLANELDEFAETMENEGNSRNGRSRGRYLSLATTLEGIAGQLR